MTPEQRRAIWEQQRDYLIKANRFNKINGFDQGPDAAYGMNPEDLREIEMRRQGTIGAMKEGGATFYPGTNAPPAPPPQAVAPTPWGLNLMNYFNAGQPLPQPVAAVPQVYNGWRI